MFNRSTMLYLQLLWHIQDKNIALTYQPMLDSFQLFNSSFLKQFSPLEREYFGSSMRHFPRTCSLKTSLHPYNPELVQYNGSGKCALLKVSNLAQTHWIPVDCSKKLLSDVVCTRQPTNCPSFSAQEIKACLKGIVNLDLCIQFLSLTHQISNKKTMLNFQNISWLQIVFRAVGVTFPAILKDVPPKKDIVQLFSYTYFWRTYLYKTHMINKAKLTGRNVTQIVTAKALGNFTEKYQSLIFQCSHDEYISSYLLCDTTKHCSAKTPDQDFNDEQRSVCETKALRVIMLQNIFKVSRSKQNSLRDISKHVKHRRISLQDIEGLNLPCKHNRKVTFQTSDICKFILKRNTLFPCTDGSHIEECKDFECNRMFKCPNFYCVPLSYVCDGKLDCPFGSDEQIDICKNENACPNHFHCKDSKVCSHIMDICNGVIDCPFGDDEYLCDLVGVKCPESCTCFHHSLFCNGSKLPDLSLNLSPFLEVSMIFCDLKHFDHMQFENLQVLNVPHNKLSDICERLFSTQKLQLVNFAHNRMKTIEAYCFRSHTMIRQIILNWNEIQNLEAGAFCCFELLDKIDLSVNQIHYLEKAMFGNASSRVVLLLNSNPLVFINTNVREIFDNFEIISDRFPVHCILPETLKTQQRNVICENLLSTPSLNVGSTILVCVQAISCVVTGIYIFRKNAKKNTYVVIVRSYCVPDLFMLCYTIFLKASNIFQNNNIAFFQSLFWKKHPMCGVAFCLTVVGILLYIFISMILSVSRKSVVTNPVRTKLKETCFVQRILIFAFLASSLAGCSVYLWTLFTNIGDPFCFAFRNIDWRNSHTIWTLATLQFLCIGLEICCAISILLCLSKKNKIQSSKRLKQKTVAVKLLLFIVFHFVCWVPSSIIFALHSFMFQHDSELFFWTLFSFVTIQVIVSPIILFPSNVVLCKRQSIKSGSSV